MTLSEIILKYPTTDDFLLAVANKVLEIADAQPDFRYVTSTQPNVTCRYNGSATPAGSGPKCSGCLLGQALQRLGWNNKKELRCSMQFSHMLWSTIELKGHARITALRLLNKLSNVQKRQDAGHTWDKCVTQLRRYINSTTAST